MTKQIDIRLTPNEAYDAMNSQTLKRACEYAAALVSEHGGIVTIKISVQRRRKTNAPQGK